MKPGLSDIQLEVWDDEIIVSLPGTNYAVTYYKPANSPQHQRKRSSWPEPGRRRRDVFLFKSFSEEGEFTVTLPGGDTIVAQLAGRDPTTDVALLRIDRSDIQPFSLTASPVAAGALTMAVGAQGGTSTAALGVVSRAAVPGDPYVAARSTPGSSLICA